MALDALRSIGRQYRTLQTRRLCARAAGICTALLIAAPLSALSCMPYGIPEALQDVIKAKEGYVAATGILTFDQRALPKVDMSRQDKTPPVTRISARLKGQALTKSGFTHPFNRTLALEVSCFGPWCASAVSGKNVLAFLKQTSAGYVLATNPCGGLVFYEPSVKTLDKVIQCYIKNRCPKPTRH